MKVILLLLFFFSSLSFAVENFQIPIRPPYLLSPLELKKSGTLKIPDETKKEAIPTSWGGNSLTQEEREIMGIKNKVFTLSGGAWILHRKVHLSAATIEIVGENAILGELKNGVKVEDKERGVTFYSGNGLYNKLTETILLERNPRLYYKDKQNKTTKVTCTRIQRFMAESRTELQENVIIENDDYVIYANKATFNEQEKTLYLDEYPFIFGKNLFITGKKASYNNDSGITRLEENTILLQNSYKTKPVKFSKEKKTEETPVLEEEKKERIVSIFTGDKLIREDSGKKEESYAGMFGHARLYRPDYEFEAEEAKARGEKLENIEAKKNVVFWDKENKIKVWGNFYSYNKEEDYMHITEGAKVEFFNNLQDEEPKSTLTAVEIERFGSLKEVVARGNVLIQTEKATARGQYASYLEEEEKLELLGAPALLGKNGVLRCGKIILYPKTDRAVITEGIKVEKK
ncbi:MAG: hypothetical protein H7A25_13915 [Leptospiraceae bacterium]|nr:hypothetical protein [Leptospiraceae bacterium]MCP5500998.1 hypothetical protein [Leptospiraceae bacterium]